MLRSAWTGRTTYKSFREADEGGSWGRGGASSSQAMLLVGGHSTACEEDRREVGG